MKELPAGCHQGQFCSTCGQSRLNSLSYYLVGKDIRNQIVPVARGLELVVVASAKDDIEMFISDKLLHIWVELHSMNMVNTRELGRTRQDELFTCDWIEEGTDPAIEELQNKW